jgi:hypothetical protein
VELQLQNNQQQYENTIKELEATISSRQLEFDNLIKNQEKLYILKSDELTAASSEIERLKSTVCQFSELGNQVNAQNVAVESSVNLVSANELKSTRAQLQK